MATVALAYSNPSAIGGPIRPDPVANEWVFNVNVAYKDTATGTKQMDSVEIHLADTQLNTLANLKLGIANGVKAWLQANKGITVTNVIVEEWDNIPV